MPLTKKGEKIKAAMKKQYGSKKGEQIFYATENKGKIKGATKKMAEGGMATLKQVPTENKGLKKLPENVRNKMGYMAYGGMAKKGK